MINKIFGFTVLLVLLSACTLEEAKAPVHSYLVMYTDEFVPDDSSFIKDFEQRTHVHVQVVYKPTSELIPLAKGNKYNMGFDLILTHSDTLRSILRERDLLQPIKNSRLFRNLNRQFNNNHYLWLPLCHNPLVLSVKSDSTNTCTTISWKKILQDSSAVHFQLSNEQIGYYQTLLKVNSNYKNLLHAKQSPYSNKNLWHLTDYISYQQKTKNKQHFCSHVLNDHQHYLTRFTSASINKFARNKAEALLFLDYYGKFNYQIASNRNQLSTFNGIITNYTISTLNLE